MDAVAAAAAVLNRSNYARHTSGCRRPHSGKIGEPTRHRLHPERAVVPDERQLMLAASKLALSDTSFASRASRTVRVLQTGWKLIVSFALTIADKPHTAPRVTAVRCVKLGQ